MTLPTLRLPKLIAIVLFLLFIELAMSLYEWRHAWLFLVYHLVIIGSILGVIFLYVRSLPEKVLRQVLNMRHEPEPNPTDNKVIHQLQRQIQSYVDEKNLMLSALAHDIKTPLTEAFLHLELLADPEAATAIKQSLEKINRIVTTSLEYAKQSRRLKTVVVEIVSLLENMIESYADSGLDVHFHSNVEECEVPIELELFKRMMVNLLENAKKYATSCHIELTQISERFVTLRVQDNGPGVPTKFLHLLGIPYFRVDQARGSNTGGSGLGLSIVKKIVELHQGSIQFQNLEGGGFQAVIQWDLKKLKELSTQ